ncbi:hypothetical protein F5X99DRAFT_377999 [Biscogniauxia marginata]|nr:hypothetical protein F5X99DRAFT_377999 [Biscogniauxia marginata]
MSEDVSKFLLQVKELGDRRIEEDEARSRELEEKILRERKERQARREERARSISPQKSSPANTPPPATHRTSIPNAERLTLDSSPILDPPASPQSGPSPLTEDMAARGVFSTSPTKENEFPFDADSKPATPITPTKTGPMARGLSWQKRPNSQASDRPKSRPLSMVAAENAARSTNTPSEPASATETVSKDQIASALSSKDPSWFRQTADRGANSAAYRRNQVEDAPAAEMSTLRTQLPGMSRMTSHESPREESSPFPDSPTLSKLTSSAALSSAPKLDPPGGDAQLETDDSPEKSGLTSPPPLGRTSPTRTDRPVSPTKGMGGFVQSAMMKRSDSVSKRWSVSSPGMPRRNSAASNQGGYDPSNRNSVIGRSRPTSMVREPSKEPSRPTSSHRKEDLAPSVTDEPLKPEATSPEPKEHNLGEMTPPTSPSKTMDPRRWSPTKASWLESALNKPESPKSKPTLPASNQPAWMAEIQKAKAQKAANPAGERSRSSTVGHKHQVSIGGLMRSTAPGVTATPSPTVLGGLQSPPPSTSNSSRPTSTIFPKEPQSPAATAATAASAEAASTQKASESKPIDISFNSKPKLEAPKPEAPKAELPKAELPKPEAPPKKEFDFRGNLKPRHTPGASIDAGSQGNEFKNVFGKLRRTTTQNYVAPDELKDNILKGKAALSFTGGPKVSERKDEFKEAILAKKNEFQKVKSEGRGISRNDSNASEKPVPEGLAKRFELGRSNTFKKDFMTLDTTGTESKESNPVSPRDPVQEPSSGVSERFGGIGKRGSIPDITATKQDRRPSVLSKRDSFLDKQADGSPSTTAVEKETPGPGRLPGKLGGNALANRFNPALAGLLARGPPGMAASGSTGGLPPTSQSSSTAEATGNEAGPGPKLTHMTKGRARGPKRKAPTSTTAPEPVVSQKRPEHVLEKTIPEEPSTPRATQEPLVTVPKSPIASLPDSPKKAHDESPQRPQINMGVGSPIRSPTTESDNAIPKEPKSPSKVHEQVAVFAAQRRQRSPTKTSEEPSEPTSQPPSPRKLDVKRMSRFLDDFSPAVAKSPEPEKPKGIELPERSRSKDPFDKPSSPDTQQRSGAPSPTLNRSGRPLPEPLPLSFKRPLSKDGAKSDIVVPEARSGPLFGARPLPAAPASASAGSSRSPTRPFPKEQAPPPLSSPVPTSPPPPASPARSPTKQPQDASTMLSDFFGAERPKRKYGVDAAELLMRKPITAPPKIQTLNVQLFQFAADGKKLPVPAHRERVLFEREMYLCPHTFNNESGKKVTEVYFWAGDDVPASTIEDASIFVSREARSFGGKLVKLQQGKETAEFLQALGGTVITQRGSGNKYDSLAPHMLCGRRYLGQVVFDEVDFTPVVLCSGFPYVITQAGKCYLWKGKGSGVDELSCARLIGMDYALSGEMQEVEDGHEPASFWELFMGGTRFTSADHWRLKPNYDKYCCKLFSSDAASKQQIMELSPFSQADLQPTGVYIVDAFFELYIIVGARAQAQYTSFHNALDFAQEYAILAAGMEDRPFVPVSTVVMEGIPRDLKSVFRKWRDAHSPTIMNTNNTGLKRGRSLKIVSLNQALQALSD